ncbi:MAG: biopolymer transporter ExbD [Planctomycetota bacterium]
MALGSFNGEDGETKLVAEINVTPLTDIFLVLLIIFMVTQSAIVESAAKVDLPKATQTTSESNGITIAVTADHRVFVNQQQVAIDALERTLGDLLKNDTRKLVCLQGDRSVILGEAVNVMDIASRAGAQEFSIAAQRETAR